MGRLADQYTLLWQSRFSHPSHVSCNNFVTYLNILWWLKTDLMMKVPLPAAPTPSPPYRNKLKLGKYMCYNIATSVKCFKTTGTNNKKWPVAMWYVVYLHIVQCKMFAACLRVPVAESTKSVNMINGLQIHEDDRHEVGDKFTTPNNRPRSIKDSISKLHVHCTTLSSK